MRRLLIKGKSTEIAEHDYLDLIGNVAKGYRMLAGAYHNAHLGGFPDWKGILQFPDVGQYEVAEDIAGQIDDRVLSAALEATKAYLRGLQQLDARMVGWLAVYAGLPHPAHKKERARLERRLQKITLHGPDGLPQGPVWALHPEYQALVAESTALLSALDEAEQQVHDRIQELLEGTAK